VFAVLAGLDAELMLAERFVAHAIEAIEVRRLRRHARLKQQRLRLLAQRSGVALPLLDSRALVPMFLQAGFECLQRGDHCVQALAELL
jgi:hypothetical protein